LWFLCPGGSEATRGGNKLTNELAGDIMDGLFPPQIDKPAKDTQRLADLLFGYGRGVYSRLPYPSSRAPVCRPEGLTRKGPEMKDMEGNQRPRRIEEPRQGPRYRNMNRERENEEPSDELLSRPRFSEGRLSGDIYREQRQ